jgi:hypothetical protein
MKAQITDTDLTKAGYNQHKCYGTPGFTHFWQKSVTVGDYKGVFSLYLDGEGRKRPFASMKVTDQQGHACKGKILIGSYSIPEIEKALIAALPTK